MDRSSSAYLFGNNVDGHAMSVINQVLNQLEQRGAHTAPEQTMVRAVPPAKRNFTLPLLAFCLTLVAGIAAWQWAQSRESVLSLSKQPVRSSAAGQVVEATSVTQQPVAAMPVASMPAATMPVAAEAPPKRPSPGLPPAVLRLSVALDSVPLPSTDTGRSTPDIQQPPKKSATPKAQAAIKTSSGESSMKQVSPAQRADAEFRKAVALMQQGRIADAVAGYETALRLDAGHDAARQALVALLLENKRGVEAERVLLERLKSKPEHIAFTMLLARLQVDRGAVEEAAATLEKSLPFANKQADYHAFLAALLQRLNRHEEAISHYQIVTQLAPANGVWLMGYGISLQAVKRNADAKAMFQKALDTQTLNADLQAFVQGKIKEL